MDRKTKWRTFWLAAITALSVLILLPSVVGRQALPRWYTDVFDKKIQLGLDLQGGLHIVYSINLDKAVDDKSFELKRDLETQFGEKKIAARVTTPGTPLGSVNVYLEDASKVEQVRKQIATDYDEVIEFRDCPADAGEGGICFRVSPDYADRIKQSALEQAIRTVRERINEKGVSEPSVVSKGDQIIVELPGLDKVEIKRVKDLIARTAKLEFKIVDENSEYMQKLYGHVAEDPKAQELGIGVDIDRWTHDETGKVFTDYYLTAQDREKFLTHDEADAIGCIELDDSDYDPRGRRCTITGRQVLQKYLEELAAENPQFAVDAEHQIGYELRRAQTSDDEPDWRTYYLLRAVELAGTAVQNSYVYWNPTTNRPEVLVEFNRWGGRRFGELTGNNVGRKMAIILDDKINSAPTIQSRIDGGSSSISMGGSDPKQVEVEANDLVNVLRTGSLPAPLQIDSESEVGPLLGRDAIGKAQLSFILGTILVIVVMCLYYRTSGFISIIALSLNILLVLAIMALFGATLTLPGIAALVLTVGMAVDANIIIYERIREELRAGKSIKGSVDAGFSHALSAIIDGQITTGAAGFVLYQYGSGPIKGFAVMLMIGIITTLFTATWCTRLFFEYYVGRGRRTTIAI